MFGKGGGALSTWLREFCQLVFIQTIQAFIYAVVIGMIVKINIANVTNANDRNAALGIICVVALTSIFKVEDLARKIFGFGPTKADHGNAVASLGKTAFALRMGKNVLDNGTKVVKGAGAVIGSHTQKVKAYKNYNRKLDALNKDNAGINPLSSGGADSSGGGGKSQLSIKNINSEKRDQKIQLQQDAAKARKMAMNETDPNKKKALIAEAKSKLAESKKINEFEEYTSSNSSNASAGNSASKGSSGIKDYNQKKLQFEEARDKEMKEIDKSRREGLKNMVSGFAETGAALVGFTAGTVMSGADGDWGNAVKDGVAWAGAADAVTAKAVDMTAAVGEFVDDRLINAGKLVSEYAQNVAASYDESIQEATEKSLMGLSNPVTRGTKIKTGAKALAGGGKRTAQSHSVLHQERLFNQKLEQLGNRGRDYNDKDVYE